MFPHWISPFCIISLSEPDLSHTMSFSRMSSTVALNTCRTVRHVPYKRAPTLFGCITKEWIYSSGSPVSGLNQGHISVVAYCRVRSRRRACLKLIVGLTNSGYHYMCSLHVPTNPDVLPGGCSEDSASNRWRGWMGDFETS